MKWIVLAFIILASAITIPSAHAIEYCSLAVTCSGTFIYGSGPSSADLRAIDCVNVEALEGLCLVCDSGEEAFTTLSEQNICAPICPYYDASDTARGRYLDTGACIYDGTCRGDADGSGIYGYGEGTGCCGEPGGNRELPGQRVDFPGPTRPKEPTTACAWEGEKIGSPVGYITCPVGYPITEAPYFINDPCATNTDGQPTLLEDRYGPTTTILPSNPQPTVTTYTTVQQEMIYPGAIPFCTGPDAYTLSSISCPSGYTLESTQNVALGYCVDEAVGYFDGTEQLISGTSITCSKTVPVASSGTAVPYTITNTASGCQGSTAQNCAPGYDQTGISFSFGDPVYCSIMGSGIWLPQMSTTITCTPTPVVGCGNGVCDWTESGDATAGNYCQEDCTITTYASSAQCPLSAPVWNELQGRCEQPCNIINGYTWNPNTLACERPQCGETGYGTEGRSCSTLDNAQAGYYCSQGYNNQAAPTAICCPVNTYAEFDGVNWGCSGSNECYSGRCAFQPPDPNYFSDPLCVGPIASWVNTPGACCSVGMKDGVNPFYDYSDANGITTNNFRVY